MQNLREIVNGGLLQVFNGKSVSVTGMASQTNPNGLYFELRTFDDHTVKVILKKPLRNPVKGLIEVHGIAHGNSVNCEDIIEFEEENWLQPFDGANHNRLCELLNTATKLWEMN